MPSKSKSQAKFMRIAANNAGFARAHGITQQQAKEFVAADKQRGTSKLPQRKAKKTK